MITIQEVKTAEELAEVINSNENVIVDFFKLGCNPCKMTELLLSKLQKEGADQEVAVVKACLEVIGQETFTEYDVRSVPTLQFFKEGSVVRSNPGLMAMDKLKGAIVEHF